MKELKELKLLVKQRNQSKMWQIQMDKKLSAIFF
jgi:hypothetical protein